MNRALALLALAALAAADEAAPASAWPTADQAVLPRTDAIVWDAKTRAVRAALEDREAVVEFTGTCVSDSVVSLVAEHTCGCMDITVAPAAPKLAEACAVRVRVDLAAVPGDTTKTVRLRTTLADGRVEATRLEIRIAVPAAIAVDPPALYWDRSEDLAAKSATVRPLVEGVVIAARVDSPAWTVAIATDGSTVVVQPLSRPEDLPEERRNGCRYAMCRLTARLPSGASKEYVLWGVQRP